LLIYIVQLLDKCKKKHYLNLSVRRIGNVETTRESLHPQLATVWTFITRRQHIRCWHVLVFYGIFVSVGQWKL